MLVGPLFFDLYVPRRWWTGPLFVVSAALAVVICFGCRYLVNATAYWLLDATASVALAFAGGAQFLAVGLLAAGSPVAAVVAGLLINARHFPFGLALGDTLRARWRDRLLGAHLMIDESVAFALGRTGTGERRRAYWLTGGTLFVTWNLGTILGGLLGSLGDPTRWGLDAAFPAGLLALLLPSLRDPRTWAVATLGAVIAVLTSPLLPAGLPVLLALTGFAALVVFPGSGRAEPVAAAGQVDAGAADAPALDAGVAVEAGAVNAAGEQRC
jgi:predicted branched-subunit amino acid permease